ncbi:MAG: FAD binding domain-containing protein, partial [Bacilli bacterium]|nr:FAD binding domain-containing protein [Bacilli bacterium]
MRINNYIESVSVKEAYEQLLEHPLNGILGGGTWLKLTNGKLETLIGLKDLGLDQITETSEELIIGSQTTLRAIETNDTARHLADGILADAASHIMGVTLRNLATIGGTVCGRYPFSDLLTVLLAMDAKLEFFNQKLILLSDYLNSKRPELDILLNVRIPK